MPHAAFPPNTPGIPPLPMALGTHRQAFSTWVTVWKHPPFPQGLHTGGALQHLEANPPCGSAPDAGRFTEFTPGDCSLQTSVQEGDIGLEKLRNLTACSTTEQTTTLLELQTDRWACLQCISLGRGWQLPGLSHAVILGLPILLLPRGCGLGPRASGETWGVQSTSTPLSPNCSSSALLCSRPMLCVGRRVFFSRHLPLRS